MFLYVYVKVKDRLFACGLYYVQPVMCVERTGQEMVHGPRFFSEDNIPPTIFQYFWFMVKGFFYSQHSTTYFSIFLVYGPRFYSTDNIPPTAFQYFWFMVQDSFLQIILYQPIGGKHRELYVVSCSLVQ